MIVRRSGRHVGGLSAPFAPWLPLALSRRFIDFPARNYWPGELRRMTAAAGFTVLAHRFVWQTFEGHGRDDLPPSASRVRKLLRGLANTLERVPLVRVFAVSQLVIARKP